MALTPDSLPTFEGMWLRCTESLGQQTPGCSSPPVRIQLSRWVQQSLLVVVLRTDHQLWDLKTFKIRIDLPGHTDEVYCVDFVADKVVSGGRDKTVKMWVYFLPRGAYADMVAGRIRETSRDTTVALIADCVPALHVMYILHYVCLAGSRMWIRNWPRPSDSSFL
jgi:hypothetical protein